MIVGILHPGAMGAAVGGACVETVIWAGEGRSVETARRAEENGLRDVIGLHRLVREAEVIVSVCPPHAASEVAERVARAGFAGTYVDANAIAPQLSEEIGARFRQYVDGGIIGPPPRWPGSTRMYLCGDGAEAVARLWDGSALEARVVAGPVGAASALKVAYAAWTKGSTALLLAARAYAEAAGVGEPLDDEWRLSMPELPERLDAVAGRIGIKAWRFAGEMEQIAAAMESVGMPEGFHRAAAEIYSRLAGLKATEGATLDEVVALVTGDEQSRAR